MAERDLDVVVLGASSVTGRRVAAHLADRVAATGARWAAAGRDPGKIERVLAEAGTRAPETIAADVGDPGSLAALAARARVVLNLVGPYTLHGRPVIAACVEGGADYVDLTGEIPFVRRVIAEFDEPARAAGVKVIQVCGFECLPPDLSVQLAVEAAAERWDEPLVEADLEYANVRAPMPPRPSDLFSGGTMQSLAAAVGDEDAAVIADPACLIDDRALAAAVRAASPISLRLRRGRDGSVVGPMLPAAFINPAVIQRSFGLRSGEFGTRPVRYREGASLGIEGPAPIRAGFTAFGAVMAGVQSGFMRLGAASPGARRRVSAGLSRVLPSSGFGPAAERLDAWDWTMSLVGRTEGGNEVGVQVDGRGHPGYLATARMLGEAGLLLAEDGATPRRPGCVTPAIGIGTANVERFERAQISFSVT